MKHIERTLCGLALLTLACTSATAALAVRDLLTPGDSHITFDTTTRLEWLDLTETGTRSYDDMLVGLGPGGEFAGWRYATLAETLNMFNANFDPGAIVPVSPVESAAAVPIVEAFFSFFGIADAVTCAGTVPPGPCPRSQGRTGTSLSAGTHEVVGFITIGGRARGAEIRQALPDSVAGGPQFASFLIRNDSDSDGFPDTADNCPNTANPDQRDTDNDGRGNPCDNCSLAANNGELNTGPAQNDADQDGYGNLCDADLNNSGMVTTADFGILRSVLNQSALSSSTAAAADLNGSGVVTTSDFAILRARLNTAPGPSGLVP